MTPVSTKARRDGEAPRRHASSSPAADRATLWRKSASAGFGSPAWPAPTAPPRRGGAPIQLARVAARCLPASARVGELTVEAQARRGRRRASPAAGATRGSVPRGRPRRSALGWPGRGRRTAAGPAPKRSITWRRRRRRSRARWPRTRRRVSSVLAQCHEPGEQAAASPLLLAVRARSNSPRRRPARRAAPPRRPAR